MAMMTAMEKDAMAGQFYRLIVRGRRKEAMEFALMHKNKFSALEKACREKCGVPEGEGSIFREYWSGDE